MRLHVMVPTVVAASLASAIFFGCETNLRCDDDACVEDADEVCEAGRGDWGRWDCGGALHHCDLVACEIGIAAGCGCEADFCWDGEACIPLSTHDQQVCEAGGGSWEEQDCGGGRDECGQRVCLHWIGLGCACEGDLCWDGEACVLELPEE